GSARGRRPHPGLRRAGPRPAHRGDGRPGEAGLPGPAQGAQLRHRFRPVLHPAVAVGGRDGGVHADRADEPAGARGGCLRVADRAGGLAAGGGDRGAPDGGADGGAALGDRAADGPGGGHGRIPVPGERVFRGDRAVAERAVRRGGPDPGPGAADAAADVGGRHVPGADQPRLLRGAAPVPADELRGRGAAAAHHGRRARSGVAGVRGAGGLHRGRAGAARPVGPAPPGVDAGPAAPGAEPVTGRPGGAVTIRAMGSSSAASGGSARREATRQRLYEAAVTLIAEQGFSATTVDEIAERAGVAKGTVYYNFASKSVLFEELLRHGVGLLTASLKEAADRTAGAGGSA